MTEARYAGFWVRLLADAIDTVILVVVTWLMELGLLGIVFLFTPTSAPFSDAFNPFSLQIMAVVLYVAAATAYFVVGHYRYGTTAGKAALSIYVVSEKGGGAISLRQAFVRCFAYLLSAIPLCAGFLMAAFHPEKRALHDLIAGTVSVRTHGKRKGSEVHS